MKQMPNKTTTMEAIRRTEMMIGSIELRRGMAHQGYGNNADLLQEKRILERLKAVYANP